MAHSACHDPEGEGHQEHIAEEDEAAGKMCDFQREEKVEYGVQEQEDSRAARGKERSPPPVVVLVAQLEVTEQDRNLSAGHHQNQEHARQDWEDVIKLVLPDGAHHEEQFNEHGRKRQHSTSDKSHPKALIPRQVFRLRSWKGVHPHRSFNRFFLECKITADICQWDRYSKPQDKQGNQSAKGNGSRGLLTPDNQIQDKKIVNTIPGKKSAVRKVCLTQSVSLNIL